jgi:hypothetical protein
VGEDLGGVKTKSACQHAAAILCEKDTDQKKQIPAVVPPCPFGQAGFGIKRMMGSGNMKTGRLIPDTYNFMMSFAAFIPER